jgi:predicted permease
MSNISEMKAIQNKFAPLKRNARRAIVLTCYLGAIIMAFGWTLEQPLRWFVVIPFGIACILTMASLLMPYALGVSDGGDEMLDERQQQTRNLNYLNAYRILGLIVMFTMLYWYIATDSGRFWLPKTSYEINVVFWGVMLLAITLPTAIAAWTEPDPMLEKD